jgi:hypothetical protein
MMEIIKSVIILTGYALTFVGFYKELDYHLSKYGDNGRGIVYVAAGIGMLIIGAVI